MNNYGVVETNNVNDVFGEGGFVKHLNTFAEDTYHISEVAKLTRIRLLTERGYPYMDVSYIHGVLADGTNVHVINDTPHALGRKTYRSQLAAWAKKHGKDANKIGIWNSGTYSILYG